MKIYIYKAAIKYNSPSDFHNAYELTALFRSVFGLALKELSCPLKNGNCEECVRSFECPYAVVFKGRRLVKGPDNSKFGITDIPAPIIISFADIFNFSITMAGEANKFLPFVIIAIQRAGELGIGRDRLKFILTSLKAADVLNNEETQMLQGGSIINADHPFSFSSLKPQNAGSVAIEFTTPTILKSGGKLISSPDFIRIYQGIRLRMSLLNEFYCGDDSYKKNEPGREAAESVIMAGSAYRRYNYSRFSRSSGNEQELSGFIGKGEYIGNLSDFIPYLFFGQFLNIGKAAAFGNGKFSFKIK